MHQRAVGVQRRGPVLVERSQRPTALLLERQLLRNAPVPVRNRRQLRRSGSPVQLRRRQRPKGGRFRSVRSKKKTVPQTKMEENEKRIFHTGAVTNKMLLPVTALNFGRTWSKASSGRYTLGPLECSGSVASAPAGIPESCGQLQRIGHHLPALYQIRRNGATGTVYCDLTRQPGDQGID